MVGGIGQDVPNLAIGSGNAQPRVAGGVVTLLDKPPLLAMARVAGGGVSADMVLEVGSLQGRLVQAVGGTADGLGPRGTGVAAGCGAGMVDFRGCVTHENLSLLRPPGRGLSRLTGGETARWRRRLRHQH